MPTANPTPIETATPNPTPGGVGPYVVKQIESLGGETVSGQVCSLTQAFTVTSVSPTITFLLNFVPITADHGEVAYAYSFPSLGESHNATGTYQITQAASDGTLLLSMKVTDHVVFTGFDGNIPLKYRFNLVPSNQTTCPGQ